MDGLMGWLDAPRPVSASPLGWRCLQLAWLVLPSSALIAGLLCITGFACATRLQWRACWNDWLNRLILLVSLLMVLSCTVASSGGLAWLGLVNWLPFFWGFWCWQTYLTTAAARRRCGQMLLAGTVPVLITGLGQMGLGWAGPWSLLGGAVIWFVDAAGQPDGRLSGLFDYANIAAAWLLLSWPFVLAGLLAPCLNRSQRGLAFLLVTAQAAALVLTASRNAWMLAVAALPLLLGPGSWVWLLPLLGALLLPVLLAVLPGVSDLLQEPARTLVPDAIWERLSDADVHRNLASTRLGQWATALELIAQRPWWGWGAQAFGPTYLALTGAHHPHPHNLPIDLGFTWGLPATLLLLALAFRVVFKALACGILRAAPWDRAWFAAFAVLLLMHATDLPYFDARINLAGWLLLAGLRAYALAGPAGSEEAA